MSAIKNYEERIPVQAIQFEGFPATDISEVMTFTGKTVSLEFSPTGISLSIVVTQLNRLVIPVGDYVVKTETGEILHMKKAPFESRFQLVV
ncbi:MAG: hypothetical protein ABS894_00570 [Aerococcus urinaeequi]